jgi:hypothetical protein
MNLFHRKTLGEESAEIALGAFFALLKAILIALVLLVAVLVTAQSTVSPVSVRLLTTYVMEYSVARFKPYRGYFPEPYALKFEKK